VEALEVARVEAVTAAVATVAELERARGESAVEKVEGAKAEVRVVVKEVEGRVVAWVAEMEVEGRAVATVAVARAVAWAVARAVARAVSSG